MIIADVPLDEDDLVAHDGVDLTHDQMALHDPLEPGQLLLIRSLAGISRCAEVVGLDFTPTDTVYQLRYGLPVGEEMVVSLTHRRPAPRRWVSDADVLGLLAERAVLSRRAVVVR
jgi:hypothetical protein